MEKFIRWLVNALVRMVAKVEVHGYENIPGKGGFIIATNHLGIIDAPMANYVLGSLNLFVPVAEKWEENPLFRWLGKPLNLIFIDRFNLDMKAMREILRRMNEGQTLVIAPEGTRSRNEQMAEGKPGVAYLAARYGWPVMPVALSGTEDRVPPGQFEASSPYTRHYPRRGDFQPAAAAPRRARRLPETKHRRDHGPHRGHAARAKPRGLCRPPAHEGTAG